MSPKHKNKNRLALIRKRKGLEQKQVAAFLGHKTTDTVSRFERGATIPSLKAAFKLAIIYDLPVQILLDEYYKSCLGEIKKRDKNFDSLENNSGSTGSKTKSRDEFCTFEKLLKSAEVTETDLNKVRHHVTELLQVRRKKMNHSAEH